ncbi:hypothetical protein, partial [Roseomonas sp. KE2513]|uniref:hypothetical protein n=1 Tax=Roseomonas sp. KE2513 TaxID=2479202 RepID=UPI001E4B3CF4
LASCLVLRAEERVRQVFDAHEALRMSRLVRGARHALAGIASRRHARPVFCIGRRSVFLHK